MPSSQENNACSVEAAPTPRGSRRRRLWELPGAAHCPVIGVCLPIKRLRRLVDQVAGGLVVADDYEVHCGAIADSKHRSRMAEALQRALDDGHAQALHQSARCRTTQDLRRWWQMESTQGDLAGALWATLTHPRCDVPLQEAVLRDVHMLQHQLGAAERAEAQHLQSLMHENAVLARELGAAQQRSTRVAQEQARKIDQLQAQAVQLRAALIGRDTLVGQLREELQALVLGDRAVLCVGSPPASVPIYRALVEETGARFLHHDGGEEDNPAQLDATLAAADLVICQTGCVSHGAYWRVKDHCKRTGKQCVFVEQPSRSSLQRVLRIANSY